MKAPSLTIGIEEEYQIIDPTTGTAPSHRLTSAFGINWSGSNENMFPRPSHDGHIPCGLLKLKSCGEGGS